MQLLHSFTEISFPSTRLNALLYPFTSSDKADLQSN